MEAIASGMLRPQLRGGHVQSVQVQSPKCQLTAQQTTTPWCLGASAESTTDLGALKFDLGKVRKEFIAPQLPSQQSALMSSCRLRKERCASRPNPLKPRAQASNDVAEKKTSPREPVKRVAVIGSGVSGLAAAKAFLQEGGFEVRVFEQHSELGGLWAKTYETARIQNGKRLYEFSDFPMPEEYPVLPNKDQVMDYLKAFAEHFGLTKHIEFGTCVVSMQKADSSRPPNASWSNCSWILELEKQGEKTSEEFDFVVLCLGNYSEKPKVPTFPTGKGPEVFSGDWMHSASFRSAHGLQGKRVAVVGFGKTALDLTAAVANAQEESKLPVTLVYRSAKWIIPRKAAQQAASGRKPYSRFSELWFPKPDRHWAEHMLHSLGSPLVWLYWAIQQLLLGSMLKGMAEKGYRPLDSLRDDLSCTLAIEPDGFQEFVQSGRIVLKQVNDWHFTTEGLLLDGDEQLGVDAVVLCTGYDGPGKLAQILPEEDVEHLREHKDGLHLYRGMLHSAIPGVAFLGYNMTFSVVHSSELGAQWIAKLASGTFSLPDAAEMERDREKWRSFRETSWLFYRDRGQCFAPLSLTYYDMLRADMGWPKLGLSSNPLKNVITPIASNEVCQP